MLRRPKIITDSSPKEDDEDVKLQHNAQSAPKIPSTNNYRRYYLLSIIIGTSLGLGYFIGSRTLPSHVAVVQKQVPTNLLKTKDNHASDIRTYASVMEANFGASVKMPDRQLLRHLNSKKIKNRKRHTPNRRELLESLYGIKGEGETSSFYDGFSFPSDQASRYSIGKYVSNFMK